MHKFYNYHTSTASTQVSQRKKNIQFSNLNMHDRVMKLERGGKHARS